MSLTTSNSFFSILQNEGIITVGKALDLGCGNFLDAQNFSKEGFTVDAVDIKDLSAELPVDPHINFIQSRIEDFVIKPESYTLVSAQMSLQFLSRIDAEKTIKAMIDGTVKGGVIVLTIIGERDEWAHGKKWDSWTREEADTFFEKLPVKIHKVMTREGFGRTKAGSMKFWHVFTYVFIKS